MQITDLRTEYQKNPLGMDTVRPRFSWKIESEQTDTVQTAYQIQVMSEGQMVWDCGRRESDRSVLVEYAGPALLAEQIYEYRVRIWDKPGTLRQDCFPGQIFRQGGLHIPLQKKRRPVRFLCGQYR